MAESDIGDASLCTSCGLCCDGTLFDRAYLAEDEVAAMAGLGLDVRQYGDRPGFCQPCRQLSGALCGVYAARPSACRSYRCMTLMALESGEIDQPEARRRVAAALGAAAQVRQLVPAQGPLSELSVGLGHTARPQVKLALGVLDVVLDRYFRKPHQRRLPGSVAAADE